MIEIFSEVENNLGIRFTCKKRSGELATGELKDVLNSLDLNEDIKYQDLKEKIWVFLKIDDYPQNIKTERDNIREKNINNAGGFPISREEGEILLKTLNLPITTKKKELEKVLYEKITGNKSLR